MAYLAYTPKYSILLRSLLIYCLTGLNYQRKQRWEVRRGRRGLGKERDEVLFQKKGL